MLRYEVSKTWRVEPKFKKKIQKLLVKLALESEGMGIRGQGSLHCALMSSFCPLGDETEAGWVMKAAQGASRTLSPSSAKFYSMESIRGMKTNQTDTKLICSCICPPTLIYPIYLFIYLFPIYSSLPPCTSAYPIYHHVPPTSTSSTSIYHVSCLLSSHLLVFTSCLPQLTLFTMLPTLYPIHHHLIYFHLIFVYLQFNPVCPIYHLSTLCTSFMLI